MTDYLFSFKIDYPSNPAGRKDWNSRYSLNAYYAGKHWRERKNDAEYWHMLCQNAVQKQCRGMSVISDTPVVISMWFNDNLDCSNHAAMVKMIEDALKGTVIPDDSKKYVKGIYMGFHDEPYIKVNVKSYKENQHENGD